MSPKEKEEKREEQEEEKEEGNSFQNKHRDLNQDEINMNKSKPFVQNSPGNMDEGRVSYIRN